MGNGGFTQRQKIGEIQIDLYNQIQGRWNNQEV